MPLQRRAGFSLAEWLVLCLVSEGPKHGFAIAGLLAPDGSLGQVWHVDKAAVYRAAQRLERFGLIAVSDKQPSRLGPDLAQLHATPAGRQAADGWLRQPAGWPPELGDAPPPTSMSASAAETPAAPSIRSDMCGCSSKQLRVSVAVGVGGIPVRRRPRLRTPLSGAT